MKISEFEDILKNAILYPDSINNYYDIAGNLSTCSFYKNNLCYLQYYVLANEIFIFGYLRDIIKSLLKPYYNDKDFEIAMKEVDNAIKNYITTEFNIKIDTITIDLF